MTLRAAGSTGGNLQSFTTPSFARLWPDYVMVIDQQNIIVPQFDNTNGNHNMDINGWIASNKLPPTAKGVVLNVSCEIDAVGVINTVNQSELIFYADSTFTNQADFVKFVCREWAAIAAGSTILNAISKVMVPIVNNKLYYNVSGSRAIQNFDLFLCGYWDTQ